MTRRRKPKTAEQVAAQQAGAAERRAQVATWRAQGLHVATDKRTGEVTRVVRLDVFDLLRERRALDGDAYEAWRDHALDRETADGAQAPQTGERVQRSADGAPGQNVTQRMVDAHALVEATLGRLSPATRRLVDALNAPGAALLTRWRATVQAATGQRREEVHADRIRTAGEALAHARRVATMDARARKAKREGTT